jgi:transcriptional regulator with XRE-family HTH domain
MTNRAERSNSQGQGAGERVRFCRHTSGITLEGLAQAGGIDSQRQRRIESGIVEPTRDEIIALALVLGVGTNLLQPGTTESVIFPEGMTTEQKVDLIFADKDVEASR